MGTVMHSSKLPVKKWLYPMYLMSVSKKGLSSLQLARELGIAQEAAWRMDHKIREAWNQDALFPLHGDVEIDETYIGVKERSKHASKKLRAGRGAVVGKQAVLGMRSRDGEVRAFPCDAVDEPTLCFHVRDNAKLGASIYTDCHKGYRDMREYRHEAVTHSEGKYVRDQIHTSGIESFWSMLKRGYVGTFHHMSVKPLSRYVDEFCHLQNSKDIGTIDFMTKIAESIVSRRLTYEQLVREN